MTLTNFFECFANFKQKFILSCSGGVDSQVMLFLALQYLPHELLTVVYFNHNKRKDVDYDVAAIKSLLFATNIQLHVVPVLLDSPLSINSRFLKTPLWDLNECNAAKSLNNFQALSSNFRYNYLNDLANKLNAKVLLAQHLDDQNENLVMKLSVDASLIGFSLLSSSDVFLRPFINISKSSLISFRSQNRILFNEDSSNLSLDYTRNKFRYYLKQSRVPLLLLESLFAQALANKKSVQLIGDTLLNNMQSFYGFYALDKSLITKCNLLNLFYLLFAQLSRGRFLEFEKFVFESKSSSKFEFNGVRVFKTKNALFFTKLNNQQIITAFGFDSIGLESFALPQMQFEYEGEIMTYKSLFRKLNIPTFLRCFVPVKGVDDGVFKLYSKSLILSVYKNFIKMA